MSPTSIPGTYRVSVEAQGFGKSVREKIELLARQVAGLEVNLGLSEGQRQR